MTSLNNENNNLPFRKDIPNWDEYFIGLTQYIATRSKDPKTQVGACIVNSDHRILSVGYNGMPIGIFDDEKHWNNKHLYVSHAEDNAISFCKSNLEDSTLYVTFFPCNVCAKKIIQSKIKRVVYLNLKNSKHIPANVAMEMFEAAGVEVVKYEPTGREITIIV